MSSSPAVELVQEDADACSRGTKRDRDEPADEPVADGTAAHTDADGAAAAAGDDDQLGKYVSRDESAKKEEDGGSLNFSVITNDGEPEHGKNLITLKNIFSRQLPKMPKEYIVRLVMDRRHHSMTLYKDRTVVGGICFRPYMEQQFAEIAFCAVTATEQVKGYGTRLMNHLKEHAKKINLTHFLTYADNYAVGYFKKQGFTKQVFMNKDRWAGYIKDYDGGTLMECAINRDIDYLDVPGMIQQQREVCQRYIRQNSRSSTVYAGLSSMPSDVYEIPGIREAGWKPDDVHAKQSRQGMREEGHLQTQLRHYLKIVKANTSSWPFQEPVNTDEVTDYLDVVTDPIDISEIEQKLNDGFYKTKPMFVADLERMVANAKAYNKSDTPFYKAAVILESYIRARITMDHTLQ
eukprot:g1111.t1